MRFQFNLGGACVLGGWLLAGCSAGDGVSQAGVAGDSDRVSASDDELGRSEAAIVRPTSLGGPNEVVMIYVTVDDGTELTTRTCSGTYIAPRVVMTAAHCLDDAFLDQVFVYFGDNFSADFSQLTPDGTLLVPPPPGQPSTWAKADSFEQHPDWDRELIYPDLAVVYLDRKLPFEPLPVARFRLMEPWLNQTVKISGWGANYASTPTTGTGMNVQRTGTTCLLGSPTQADYHPEDPNPGMLDANIRKDVLKTNGRPPHSNGCFGDSGGPLIINKQGQDYVAGVNYFTGLSCEDYSLYLRMDPFLPFIDRAYNRGGQNTLVPTFDCIAPTEGGYRAFFGYRNDNGISITIPLGGKNKLVRDTLNLRPVKFLPGEHRFAFAVDFESTQSVTYVLSPGNNSPVTTLTVNSASRRCGAAEADAVECGGFCLATSGSGCPGLPPFAACHAECVRAYQFFREVFPQCLPQNSAFNQCFANTPTGPSNWTCLDGSTPLPAGCGAVTDELYACMGL